MAGIIGALSGTKSYASFTRASRSVLKRIAPLHARRTLAPLPPKPSPLKAGDQLKLDVKWEEELEEAIKGLVALSSREREVSRNQKRDTEIGLEN